MNVVSNIVNGYGYEYWAICSLLYIKLEQVIDNNSAEFISVFFAWNLSFKQIIILILHNK